MWNNTLPMSNGTNTVRNLEVDPIGNSHSSGMFTSAKLGVSWSNLTSIFQMGWGFQRPTIVQKIPHLCRGPKHWQKAPTSGWGSRFWCLKAILHELSLEGGARRPVVLWGGPSWLLKVTVSFLKRTAYSLHFKMDGWKMKFPFGMA